MAAFVLRDLKCTPETGNTKRRGHGVGAGGAFRSSYSRVNHTCIHCRHGEMAINQEHLLPFAALLEDMSSDPGTGASLAARSQLPETLAPEDPEPSSGLCVHLNTWQDTDKNIFFSEKSTSQTSKYQHQSLPSVAISHRCPTLPVLSRRYGGKMRPSILLSVGIFPFLRE